MEELGGLLASFATAPTAIFLDGDLGAGKTALSRGYLRTATGDPNLLVTSPTYLLSNVYTTPKNRVYHMDLYRLDQKEKTDDIWNLLRPLNLDFIFDSDITLLEWPERLGPAFLQRECKTTNDDTLWPKLPSDRLEVDIRIKHSPVSAGHEEDNTEDVQTRIVTIKAIGAYWTGKLNEAIADGLVEDFLYDDEENSL